MLYKTLLLTLVLAAPLRAAEPPAELLAEFDAAMLRLADAGLLPAAGGEPLAITRPARPHHELGAVLDPATANAGGAPVLAVTPGSAAERVGLRRGDRVVAINGVSIDPGTTAAQLRGALDAGSGALVLDVERDGRPLQLRGEADTIMLPGYQLLLAGVGSAGASSCGRINVFDVFPRRDDVYSVAVIAIDGAYAGQGPSFRLTPGPHTVTVAEQIDSREFLSGVDQLVRNRMTRERYKDIVIDVAPGTTYRVAAQFHEDRRHQIRENAYWSPIVWGTAQEPCS